MNIREILDYHPLPEGYYYKVKHNPDSYGRAKTIVIMKSRNKWFDKRVASHDWRDEYSSRDRRHNETQLHEFLNLTVPVLDMRPKPVKMTATSDYMHDVYTSAKYNPYRVDTTRALR